MVEEGKVDWACHANDTGSAIGNMFDLDRAVAAALEFQKTHKDTLIVVQATMNAAVSAYPWGGNSG